jgi:hypothetical protein
MEEFKNQIIREIEREVERTIKNLAEKYGLNEADAIKFIQENKEVRRGRPPKEEDGEEKKKGVRGRPPKEEKEIKHYSGEDLITRLLAEAKEKVNAVNTNAVNKNAKGVNN